MPRERAPRPPRTLALRARRSREHEAPDEAPVVAKAGRSRTLDLARMVVLSYVAFATAAATAAQAPLAPLPRILSFGTPTTITGTLTDAAGAPRPRALAQLQQNSYPYRGFIDVAHVTTGDEGTYAFADVLPDRNTQYRVIEPGAPPLPATVANTTTIYVTPKTELHSRSLGPGQVKLSIDYRHSRFFDWRNQNVYWYVRPQGQRLFRMVARTHAKSTVRGTASASAVVAPPARRFVFRACMAPSTLPGVGPPGAGTRCPRHDFKFGARASAISFDAKGSGTPAYPPASAVAAARRFVHTRAGHIGFAIADTGGRVTGYHLHQRFASASLVKGMLLVAYLRRVGKGSLSPGGRALLYPMIHVSDNNAASAVFAIIGGQSGLQRLAKTVGMTDFGTSPAWGFTQMSPADQARFFFVQESLIPKHLRGYARELLGGVAAEQSWGIPAAARPRFRVFFKGDWNPAHGIVNQAARLERRGAKVAIAVLQDSTPSMGYGEMTISGVTQRLLP
jgi:hypothetical protein